MDLPDCPPGAEGYQDSVYEVPKKPSVDETCTKAEQEFQEHLNSLKIKLEDGTTKCMVERRGRDISGKWIYRCYPCAAVCSGETILQTHISGKKHKTKLSIRSVWPKNIFDEHPFNSNSKSAGNDTSEKVLKKMAEEVDIHNKDPNDLDEKYQKFKNVRCYIQETIDNIKVPLLGIEYLIEHPPEEAHHEPSYICTLCDKQGHPRTIPNHLTCFWHRNNYLSRHFAKASSLLNSYRLQNRYREGVRVIMNRLAQRIEDKYGRMKPLCIEKAEYEKEKDCIRKWISRGFHFSDQRGSTFEEVVDVGLIESLDELNDKTKMNHPEKRDPSPPVVAAPSKPQFNTFNRSAGRQQRRGASVGSLSDISDDFDPPAVEHRQHGPSKHRGDQKARYQPYPRREPSPFRSRFAIRNTNEKANVQEKVRPPNYDHKVKLAKENYTTIQSSLKKTLAYHEKNPEKHPLYPEEWKKFWNRRYKEIQSEGKDPSKHDFKPEWIVFWTARMKELHDDELRIQMQEVYRKLCLSPPDMMRLDDKQASPAPKRKSPEWMLHAPEPRRRRRPPPGLRTPEARRRSSDRRRSPIPRRRSPDVRRPEAGRRLPEGRQRSPESRRRSPNRRLRSPDRRDLRLDDDLTSPAWHTSLRSPRRSKPARSRSPMPRGRSPARTNFVMESLRRSRSPLSLREEAMRNRSPVAAPPPSYQTVLISDDELKPDDLSPWNSDNDLDSVGSLPDMRSVAGSMASRGSKAKQPSMTPHELGPPENVVATLRLLVALEDYLGSLGPKIVDLLGQAIKMEKEKANSSEELLDQDAALVLIETAKEKLKGAVQADLVPHTAAPAVRAAVVRAAATLHEADNRARNKPKQPPVAKKAESVPVAGVGEVDRAQIAQQMAEALIAQGKTDVSAEELAQLVDAVVGMAEAKKRTADAGAAKASGTASALQMLQSAYNENDKKIEKEDAPDAMDGLSDSDLETLLKNFNELSAEEQHSLIAFLKKLETKEPARVERLRQYVSAAASNKPDDEPKERASTNLVTIESDDDDDYTVEEVFKSATQKVKEDQIRQEMEIVKKSLEESKMPPPANPETKSMPGLLDLAQAFSSAPDLLAFLQNSIQSTSASKATSSSGADVVAATTQPRSFGDLPEPVRPFTDPPKLPVPPSASISVISSLNPQNNDCQRGLLRTPNQMNQANYGGANKQDDYNQGGWNARPTNNMNAPPGDSRVAKPGHYGDNRISDNMEPYVDNQMADNRGPMPDKVGPYVDNRMAENRGPYGDNRGQMQHRPFSQPPRYDNYNQNQFNNQGPRGNFMNGNNNFDNRPDTNNQYGNNNYGNTNNFRGRGGRGQRGRGRGGYY
ncbi:hypothetical protein K1T71_003449 [Dendrolimus kikuchii]|uniref:Uncharacterized protein n=1 Tax=Dendrolimus kikuchii TaxID=765133 RepID=A0ACC1DBP8_9NEOP|nr:hypothetical protein K1T71_003449 [Dendrolimus kikuchii]